jgi:hypothetical protein
MYLSVLLYISCTALYIAVRTAYEQVHTKYSIPVMWFTFPDASPQPECRRASVVLDALPSAGRTDRDLACPQFHRNCGTVLGQLSKETIHKTALSRRRVTFPRFELRGYDSMRSMSAEVHHDSDHATVAYQFSSAHLSHYKF